MGLFRRPQREVDLTNEAYGRWLRACRPQPLVWFLGLPEGQQEALAALGDTYVQDVALAVGYAVRDPDAARAGLAALDGEPGADVDVTRRVALEAVQRILGRAVAPAAASTARQPPSMGGVSSRRVARRGREQAGKDAGRAFLGRKPDPAPEVTP